MVTQNDLVLNYLLQGNTITGKEAFIYFGIAQLPNNIRNLKEKGYNIIDKYIEVIKATNGKKAYVKQYAINNSNATVLPSQAEQSIAFAQSI